MLLLTLSCLFIDSPRRFLFLIFNLLPVYYMNLAFTLPFCEASTVNYDTHRRSFVFGSLYGLVCMIMDIILAVIVLKLYVVIVVWCVYYDILCSYFSAGYLSPLVPNNAYVVLQVAGFNSLLMQHMHQPLVAFFVQPC